jgi:PAS domain S-box-containing protein
LRRGVPRGDERQRLALLVGPRASLLQAVAVGLLVGVGAVLAKEPLNALAGGDIGFIALLAGVAFAAWFGGLTGGLTATLASGLLNAFLFMDPAGQPVALDRSDQVRLVLYLIAGAFITLLLRSVRSNNDRLLGAVTSRDELLAALSARDERLELVLSASKTGTWEWDIRSGTLSWSEAIFAQHGLDPTGAAPDFESYLLQIHPDDRPMFQEALRGAIDRRGTFELELRIIRPDGSIHWVHAFGRVFTDEAGRAVRLAGTGRDVTERRSALAQRDELLAQEARANEFRQAFIDVISHELRTPITSIYGFAQVLTRETSRLSEADRATLLHDIAFEADRLRRLIEDLLVISRAERGRLTVSSDPVHIGHLVERVAAEERSRWPSLDIRIERPDDLPLAIGEEIHIEQVVRNILGNAAKYTPAGTRVVVRAEAEPTRVVVRILDDGPGIASDGDERLFELFYREPGSDRTASGSGIGLFVCARLVEGMGGEIWARRRDAVRGGSEFGFWLPALVEEDRDLDLSPGADDERASVGASAEEGVLGS